MIKIHIRRNVPEDKKEKLRALIKQLRAKTMGKPGYIAGETLIRSDKPGESLVVTKWQSESICMIYVSAIFDFAADTRNRGWALYEYARFPVTGSDRKETPVWMQGKRKLSI